MTLRSHRRLNLIIVASRLMFTLVGMVTWVDVGGGCYSPIFGALDEHILASKYSLEFM